MAKTRADLGICAQRPGQTFDYVIVGGGLAGLTVAERLSEDSSVTVAVIEAGDSGYSNDEKFTVPAGNVYDSAVGTQYDWQWTTSAQSGLLNPDGSTGRQASWPRGKVLGGSSAINGLYYVRASQIEHDAWADLIDAPEIWGWPNMLKAMKKSETFTPPSDSITSQVDIPYNASSHGKSGPIHVTWPAKMYDAVGAFIKTVPSLGTPASENPDGGESWGTFVASSTINPHNWTRSFSRTGYLDPYTYRSNLVVLTGNQVTKVHLSGDSSSGLNATGVQFATGAGAKTHTVHARQEVVLSGGTINDPQILQLSGIGDPTLLNKYNIDVKKDLPGVGQHVQDHLASAVHFSTNSQLPEQQITGNEETDSYVNSAISYVNITTLFGDYSNTLLEELRANTTNVVNSLDAPDAVKRGYNATYTTQLNDIFTSNVGPVELLLGIAFGDIQVQAALQHPLSRGSIKINSADPFDAPTIDAGYLRNFVDLQLLREGFKMARRVGNTSPMKSLTTGETIPGSDVSSDDDWEEWIRKNVGTEYHPSCSCAQLPEHLGGVVDKNLIVYGTKNLRVIDASVPPFSLSAHLMAATYGIGEIGAELIQSARAGQAYVGTPTTTALPSSSATGSSSSSSKAGSDAVSSSSSSSGATQQKNTSASAAAATFSSAHCLSAAIGAVVLSLLVLV